MHATFIETKPASSAAIEADQTHQKPVLTAQWQLVNGKLTCKWVTQ